MKALILAGGLGTRLRPLTRSLPKPMVPIVNRPLVEHTVLHLKKHNITEIIFLLYYLPDIIKNHFKDGSQFGAKISYITAEDDYATAGAVKLASELVNDTFLVVSGDVIADLNISDFVQSHREKKALASVGLTSVDNPSPFGIAVTDQKDKIIKFLEKPAAGQIFSHHVNMGIYLLEPEIFDWIPEEQEYFFAKDLFPGLVAKQEGIYGFADNCYWLDIGNFAAYQQAHRDFFENRINLTIKEELQDGIWQGENCEIGRDVTIEGNVVLGDNCKIDDHVILSNSVIGDNCRVGRISSLTNTIVWNGVEIGENCEFNYNVVDSGLKIAYKTHAKENNFILE
ncbi:NDP-sugar synthase [candidate division KSB1 bacterium]|nr:NDP-sugar synthase [candidate division KSB1 bacterium]